MSSPPLPNFCRLTSVGHTAPRIFALECLIEIEDFHELVARVGGLAHEQSQIHEREHDVADVTAAAYAPVLEHEARHHAEALEGQVAARERELPSRDVPALVEPLLAVFEGGEHEQIRALVEPRLTQPDAVHDPVPKGQLRHHRLRK